MGGFSKVMQFATQMELFGDDYAPILAPVDVNVAIEEIKVPGNVLPGIFLDPCEGTYHGCKPGRPVLVFLHHRSFATQSTTGSAAASAGIAAVLARQANASALSCGVGGSGAAAVLTEAGN